MTKRKKQTRPKSLAEQVGGPNFYGNPSFGGTGNFGRGGYKQLAHFGLNPATQKIAQQEQDEIPDNVDRETWSLGKYQTGHMMDSDPVPHWNGRNGSVETVIEEENLEENAPYDNSTSRMRDLPGFPKMNSLVNPKGFVPANDHSRNIDPSTGNEAEYLGPTLNGVELDPDYQSPQSLANGDVEEGCIEPDWESSPGEEELKDLLGAEHMPEPDGRPEEPEEELILHNYIEETLMELLGAPKATYPSRQGWNNKQINALVWRKNHLNPEKNPPDMWHMLFKDPGGEHNPNMTQQEDPSMSSMNQANVARKTPAWSFGAIGFPKQHVPEDYEQANPDYEDIIEDPIGSRRLQMPPEENSMRQGTNSSIRETAIDVYPTTNNGKDNMTGDLNADGKGPDGGAEDFQKSREQVLSELISEIIAETIEEQRLKEQGTVAPRRGRPRPQGTGAPQPTIDLQGLRQVLAQGQQMTPQGVSQVIDYVSQASNLGQDFIQMTEPEIQTLETVINNNVAEERIAPFYNKIETARGTRHLQQPQQQQTSQQQQQKRAGSQQQATPTGKSSTTQKLNLPKQPLSQQFQNTVKQKFDQIKKAPGLNNQQREKLVASLGRIQLAPEGSEESKLRQINDLIRTNLGTDRVEMPTPQAQKQIGAPQIPQQKSGGILGKAKSMFGLNELSLKEALKEEEE